MKYIVVKNDNLIHEVNERVVFLKSFGQERTKEEVTESALVEYLNKYNYRNKFATWKKKNGFRFWQAEGKKCFYCGQHITYDQVTFDHKFPIFRGGDSKRESNIVCSCYWCNGDKGVLTEEEYRYKQLVNTSKGIHPPVPFNNHKNNKR